MKFALNTFLLFLGLLFSFSAFALKEDTKKPINIESDKQSLDIQNNRVTFTSNVVITQGSILINANQVIITRPPEGSNKKEKIEAFGKPVTFSQLLDNGKKVSGNADHIHYDLGKELLTLTGNAFLKQADSKIKASVITYDVKKQQLNANGQGKNRVKTLLFPNQLKENNKRG